MKRSAWRYLWKSKDIRRKLLISLALLAITGLPQTCRCLALRGWCRSSANQRSSGRFDQPLDMLSGGAVSNFRFWQWACTMHYRSNYSPIVNPDHPSA